MDIDVEEPLPDIVPEAGRVYDGELGVGGVAEPVTLVSAGELGHRVRPGPHLVIEQHSVYF